jgi:phosphate transport system substrate-binding protein
MLNCTSVSTYAFTAYGAPIQVAAVEVNLAIPVNVNSSSFQINSQIKSGGVIVPGGAIQLTTAQLCAIFSGLVTDWSDTTTTIPYLDGSARNRPRRSTMRTSVTAPPRRKPMRMPLFRSP